MNEPSKERDDRTPRVSKLPDAPVYQCHVYVAKLDDASRVVARMARLADFSAEGRSEREALSALVERFRRMAAECQASRSEIAWLDHEVPRRDDEADRWLAVHL